MSLTTRSVLVGRAVDRDSASELHRRLVMLGFTPQRGHHEAGRESTISTVFTSATDAVLAARSVVQPDGDQLCRSVGFGVHSGDCDNDDGEIADTPPFDFGQASEVAAAALLLADSAVPGQLLISDVVRQLWRAEGAVLTEAAGVAPAGGRSFPGPKVWTVTWDRPTIPSPIRTVVAEDVALVRAGLVALLREEGFDVVAEATTLDELMEATRAHRPRLVITDVRMPPSQSDEGIVAALQLRAEQPGLAVLVLSQHVAPSAAALLVADDPNAVGYILKERVTRIDEFVEACRTIAGGGVVIDALVTDRLLRQREGAVARLTEREREVLDLMAQGRSNIGIARQVHCSQKTVEGHIRSIFDKLGLFEDGDDNRRVAAVIQYLHARG